MKDLFPELLLERGWLLWLIPLVPIAAFVMSKFLSRRKVSRSSIWLRSLVLILLLVTLASPMIVRLGQSTTTIFVLDQSDSIQQTSADAANSWITDALSNADPDATSAIVRFGAQPDLSVPPQNANLIDGSWQSDQDAVGGETTDLASALTLARSLPVGEARRIVVLSDGSENVGDALHEADQAAQDGVSIDVVPLAGIDSGDLRLATLTGPTALWQGEDLSILATIAVGAGGPVRLDLVIDGTVVSSQDLTLPPGSTSYTLTHPALTPGFHAIEVRVSGSEQIDRIVENNSGALGLVIRDRPAVLMVVPDGADPTALKEALTVQGADVTVITPDLVGDREAEIEPYQTVLLNNVPAWNLDQNQQDALVAYVRDGGGLVAVGGSASFGPGAYAGTTLEQALPVTVRVTDGRQRPKVAVMIVMDKSGSMAYDPRAGGESKLDLAKDGVLTAASALTTGDQIGVIAFNDEPIWALPMTALTGAGDQQRISDAIAPLTADGGTEIYPALRLAYDSLRNVDADVRHIILLSDGKSNTGTRETYERLITENGDDRITLSTVALGSDSDIDLLQQLATDGHGRYHYAEKPEDIPNITFQEAQSAGSQSVIRGAFTPIQQQPSPILTNIDQGSMPPVGGYDFTAAKPDAQVDLTSDRGDPLLTKWQLGLGRVAVWTGDDGSDFTGQWQLWDGYAPFWGNVIRWTLPDPERRPLMASVARDGRDVIVTLTAMGGSSDAISPSSQEFTVTGPQGSESTRVEAVPSGPGAMTFRLDNPAPGAYQLSASSADTAGTSDIYGFAVGTSPEWQPTANGRALLTSIAERTDGDVLTLDTPASEDIFMRQADTPDASVPESVRPIWQFPLIAGLLIYLLDIAMRLGFNWHAARQLIQTRHPGTP